MKMLEISEICYHDIDVQGVEVFPETWDKRNEFSLYKSTPRPCDALLFICSDITVTYRWEQHKITAQMGDVIYIPAGTCYRVTVSGTGNVIDTYTINFTLRAAETEVRLKNDISVIAHCDGNRFVPLCEQMRSIVYQRRCNYAKMKSVFFSLLEEIAGAALEVQDLYYPIRIGVQALRQEWNQNQKIESYAALCGVSPAYFYKVFRACFGQSPVEYRNHIRLTNAAAMLHHTDMPISRIAALIGTQDPFYFSRIFTEHYGLSPQKYRQQYR